MDGIKHSRQFAEMERLVSDYFHCHLAPVMSKTQAYLTKKQGEEMREYSTSLGGILSAMASAAQPMGDPYQVLKVTGEWNSKTTEDYIGMCKAEITGSKEIQQDLAYMAGQWRDTVVQEIGRKRYDELSEQLGGDLAYAYMDYRVEELMIDRLVKERMPQSRRIKPAWTFADLQPLAACCGNRGTGRSRLPSERMGKRRGSGTGRNGRYRDDGRRGFVGNTGEVCRGGRGYLGSRLTLRA